VLERGGPVIIERQLLDPLRQAIGAEEAHADLVDLDDRAVAPHERGDRVAAADQREELAAAPNGLAEAVASPDREDTVVAAPTLEAAERPMARSTGQLGPPPFFTAARTSFGSRGGACA
jgi:hypothetical protein